jgi:branched-chain amino acid transport system ATP-binding protein
VAFVRARRLHEVLPPGGESGQVILEVENIHLAFAGVKAIDGVSFKVHTNELFAIIGPNGAGKTSVFNCISGVYHPQQGSVLFEGRQLLGMRPDRVANLGLARTFQNIELFPQMTVLDNLMLGRHRHVDYGTLAALVRVGKASREEARNREVVEGVVEFLELQAVRKSYVSMLPYGLQKRVELGRALAMAPRLLMLDEPVAGMNLEETEDMARFINDIRWELGIGIILVEHEMRMVMDLADTVLAVDFGRPIACGTPAEIQSNPDVIRAYLGEEHNTAPAGGGDS